MRKLVMAGAAVGCVALSGCVASINSHDDDMHVSNMSRTATSICRREVDHVYDDYYRISFDMPVLSTEADGRQVVVQPFNLMPRKDIAGAAGHHVTRCVVRDGALLTISEDR
ncbi:MAG: hypothetical protein PW843_23480 [Azospirillaceae bacterium]|nr:hypothetical protein [Azospirillaceae bacterium]